MGKVSALIVKHLHCVQSNLKCDSTPYKTAYMIFTYDECDALRLYTVVRFLMTVFVFLLSITCVGQLIRVGMVLALCYFSFRRVH